MAQSDDASRQVGTQGWRQFLTAKADLLAAYDRAREQSRAHEVATYHGVVAEAEFRRWLSEFLPQRYGVTPGYIVSQFARDTVKLPHFDVVIYDRLESPVLWIEGHSDASPHGRSRAIPVEYVRGVIEVKSSFEPSTVRDALTHLGDLKPLLAGVDPPGEQFRHYISAPFFSSIVFFELRLEHAYSVTGLDNALPQPPVRGGYMGGIVLRGEGLDPEGAGRLGLFTSEMPIESRIGRTKESLLGGVRMLDSRLGPNGIYYVPTIIWHPAAFANYAFDLIALLKGTYVPGKISSQHGMSWVEEAGDNTL